MSTPSAHPELPEDEGGADGPIDPPGSERDRVEQPDADGVPASGAAGGAGPPGVGEGNSGVGVETEGMPDPPELKDED